MCAGSPQFMQGLAHLSVFYRQHSKKRPWPNILLQWQGKGEKLGKKTPPSNWWSIRWHRNTGAQCDRWREQPWSEAHPCSWALWSWRGAEEVNGAARTCKGSWMSPSIFYRSLGPDTASEGMREQRSRAISTKPVIFFIKIRTHARGLKSGQRCIYP